MAESVLGELVGDPEDGVELQDTDEVDELMSSNMIMNAIQTVMRVNESQPVLNLRLQRDFRSLLRTQRRLMVKDKGQKRLIVFLNKNYKY